MNQNPKTPKPAILGSTTGSWDLSIATKNIDLYEDVDPNKEWFQETDIANLYIIPANPNLDDTGDPDLETLRDYIYDEMLLNININSPDDGDWFDFFPDFFDMTAQWMALQGQETFNWFCVQTSSNEYLQKVRAEMKETDESYSEGYLETTPDKYETYLEYANKAQEIYNTYCK